MRQENFTLIDQFVLDNLIIRLRKITLDGKTRVSIGSAGSKSVKQRSFEWLLYEAIAKSGKGGKHEDEKNGVHLVCKYRFAVPIFIRDDSFFAELWTIYRQLYGADEERMLWMVSTQVHTEKLSVSQMAEYLTELINYYALRGFELPQPEDKKLLEWRGK
jgi:hypothetical protein